MSISMIPIKPKALKKNSTIALIAPAGPITELQLARAQENLAEMGFKSTFTEKILEKKGYLAGSDEIRLNDLHDAFLNDKADAILCIRGGYGCSRIIDQVDYELIKNHPKIFIGYSDITALLNAIWQKTGLITFHGIVGTSVFTNYTKQQFKNIVSNQSTHYEIHTNNPEDLNIISKGSCTGQLVGGNLSIINSLIGTPYAVDFENKILFIEEVNEAPYKIDRMLTQLLLNGNIKNAAGIILGKFNGCDIDNIEITINNSLSLSEIFNNRLENINIPVLSGFSFGHVKDQAMFPIGIMASFDTSESSVHLIEKVLA